MKSLNVKIGSLGQILRKLTEMEDNSPGAAELENMSDYLTDPESKILTVGIDGDTAVISLHEDLIEVLSENGLEEVFK